MAELINAKGRIVRLVDLLTSSSGLLIDAQIVEATPDPLTQTPQVRVSFFGPDAALLLLKDGELLRAIQDIAVAALRLAADEHHLLSMVVDPLPAHRRSHLEHLADAGVAHVRATAEAYSFPPMLSSERRLLHQSLLPSGLKSASVGRGFKRCVVLYPEGVLPPVDRTKIPVRRHVPAGRVRPPGSSSS